MMLEKMANFEVLEIVATLDFAHRHMNQATFNDGRRIAKTLKPKRFFTELHHARQPTAEAGYWRDLALVIHRNALYSKCAAR